MALDTSGLRKERDGGFYKSPARLFLTEDREEVVAEDDPGARFLLVGEGGSIPNEVAERYGLIVDAEPEGEGDLSKLKVAELRELAAAEGVDLEGASKKAEIIAAIEGARAGGDES